MPNFEKGKLVFQSQRVGELVSAGDIFEEYECHPPPSGTVRRSNPALTHQPVMLSAYLQPDEGARIVEGTGATDFLNLNTEVFAALGFRPLTANTQPVPPSWRAVRPCYKSTIVLVFLIGAYRVDVTAKAAATIGGISYPAGDIVASYRVLSPDRWSFQLRHEFDPRCCDKAPEHPPHTNSTDWYPLPPWEWKSGLDWNHLDGFRLSPGYRYEDGGGRDEEKPMLRLKLDYKF